MHAFAKIVSVSALTAALALAAAAHAADVPITEDARVHFSVGVALLQDPKAPRYEEAYREFKAAYAAAPSYKILGNLGLCAMKIERDGEAIQAYELYLKESGFELPPEERAQIERDLLTLKAGSAQVTLSSDPPGAVIVDTRIPVQGDEIRNSYGEILTPLSILLHHGHHVMKARLPGYADTDWEFEASGTVMPAHVLQMVRPPPPPAVAPAIARSRPVPTGVYVLGGATVLLAAAGAVVGVLALKKHDDYDSLNDGTHTSAAASARSTGQTLNVVTDALFGGAIVGALVTAYLVATRPSVAERATTARVTRPDFDIGPSWGAHSAGATAVWTF
ncbi:MAG TPA: hypothetical protein VGM06_11190 [Polyangiaceae bacterium]|jgi:hypothetical protein